MKITKKSCPGGWVARILPPRLAVATLALLALPGLLSAQTILHRYSFTTDASDSVGTANGTLMNNATIVNGAVYLEGGTTSSDPGGDYVDLPNGIVAGLNSLTIEAWITDQAGLTWAEAWCFGDSSSGPGGNPGNGTYYLGMIPHSGPGDLRAAFNNSLVEQDVIETSTPLPTNIEENVTLTYDAPSHTASIYLNGARVAVNTNVTITPAALGSTYNDWIGRDQFGGDPYFTGTVDELRIWNAACSPLYLAVSAAAGPDLLITNTIPSSVAVSVTNTTMIGAETQPATVTATFPQLANVPVTPSATDWTSSNPNVLTVSQSGLITAVSGGSATVSATVGGKTGTSASITVALTTPTITQQPASATNYAGETAIFTVTALGGQLTYQWSEGGTPIAGATNATLAIPGVTASAAGSYTVKVSNSLGSITSVPATLTIVPQALVHRWSFNTDVNDSIGGADGILEGSAYLGSNALQLPGGGTSGNPNASFLQLPDGIISNLTSISVECWVTDNAGLVWAEVWCFGDSTAGQGFASSGTNYLSFIPTSGDGDMRSAFKLQNEEDVIWPATTMPLNVEEYTVVTYDAPSTTARLFLNGVQVGINTNVNITPEAMGNTFNNWVGRDEWGGDPIFTGSVDELRIWNSAVSPVYQILSLAVGPDVVITNTTPTTLSVTVTNDTMIGGSSQQATVEGSFAQTNDVIVTGGVSAWSSSSPAVITVSASGLLTAVGPGTATISATVGGVTATSATISVSQVKPQITQAPVSFSLFAGQSGSFSVTALGGDLTYQWSMAGTAIPGATNATLSFPDATVAQSGNYTVTVANGAGQTSAYAILMVSEPTLVHRWSFDGDPNDSVGGADGVLEGNATITNNTVFLPGGTTSSDPNASYVQLPDGILTNLYSMTIDCWVTDNGGQTWAEIYCFGDSTAGPGEAASGTNYISLIPTSGPGDLRGAFRLQNEIDVTWPATTLPLNAEQYVTLVYDNLATTATLYVNGVQVGINTGVTITPASLGDTFNNWLGRDEWAGDPTFLGSIDELRIYDGPLSPTDVQNNFLAGPETLVKPGTPSKVVVSITHTASGISVSWPAGTLQTAPSPTGPWTSDTSATSPLPVSATGASQFYRVVLTP